MDQQLSSLDLLAFRFFKLFARYESRLKEQQYFKVVHGSDIELEWDRFARDVIGKNFLDLLGSSRFAAEYILEHPPKRQSVGHHGRIEWTDVPATDKSVQALFGHLRRMRNNLFHGAKFGDDWVDPERSEKLLSSGLAVLEVFKARLGM